MAGPTLGDILRDSGVTAQVIIPPQLKILLDSLFLQPAIMPAPLPPTGPLIGQAQVGVEQSLFGFASLNIDPLGPKADFRLVINADSSFVIDLTYQDALKLPAALRGANVVQGPNDRHLEVLSPDTRVLLKGALVVRIAGNATIPASLRILFPGAEDALIHLRCEPNAWVWENSGMGLHLPNGIVVDDTASEAPDPPQSPTFPFASQDPAWHGISIRGAELYLPEKTPLIGKTPILVDLEVTSPAGMDARTQVTIPVEGNRPELLVTVEWHDAAATSLAIPPTSIEVVAKWQIQGSQTTFNNTPVQLAGGNPLTVRGRYARDPRDGEMRFNLSIEGGGPDGLISVTAGAGDTVPKIFVTATALATAIVADAQTNPDPERDPSGTTLHFLLVAATALSSFFTEKGKVVVHAAEVEGSMAIANRPLRLRIDYSVDVVVKKIELGVLAISMNDNVPMRIRYRNVLLEVDFRKQGLERYHLSFAGCSTLVEDPGGWQVTSPGSLLDIIGTRSGHGSAWLEIDLRFALDLGPVKVSGATLRSTFENPSSPKVELRGLDARLEVPGLVTGRGAGLVTPGGFEASMAAKIVPLGLSTGAYLRVNEPEVVILLTLDLPGPIPLANSGLGLFGLGGLFGINSKPKLPTPEAVPDPVERQLHWKYSPPETIAERPSMLLGLGAVIGTVPDLGFAFSSKAMIVVVTPDVAVRASLDSKLLAERAKMTELGTVTPPGGLRVLGLLVVDKEAVALSLRGEFILPSLLETLIPVSAYYPYGKSNWFLRIGSDGVDGRGPGPIQARLLPDLIDIRGYAYLMLHGDGITNLGNTGYSLGGFALGMGFGFDIIFPMGILLLEMSAHAVVGIASQPFMLIGQGGFQGTLHLGPFSLGVSSDIKFQVGPGDLRVFYLKVCGEVDLWFTTLRGCVEIGTETIQDGVPDPKVPVLAGVALMDWMGRQVGVPVASTPANPGDPPSTLPTVWPDALPVLEFAVGPSHTDASGISARINKAFAGDGVAGSDELRYTYSLSRLELQEFNPQTGSWSQAALQDVPSWGAWQVPKHGSSNLPGARELVLLSGELHHWTRNLSDGGEGLAEEPAKAVGNLCGADYRPLRGWALGEQANAGAPPFPWRFPSEGSWLQRFYSVFEVDVLTTYQGLDLNVYTRHPELTIHTLHPGGPTVFPQPVSSGERDFSGGLLLPHLIPEGDIHISREESPKATLTFTEPLTGVQLCLLAPEGASQTHIFGASGRDVNGVGVGLQKHEHPSPLPGMSVVEFLAPAGRELREVEIDYALTLPVWILGVSGITRRAQQTASRATDEARQTAERLTEIQIRTPAARRPMLKADQTYKLIVEVERKGQRKNKGLTDLPPQQNIYYFKTAPQEPEGSHTGLPIWVNIFQKTDTFDPSYLQRYIAGWTPADHTQYWFRNDPVEVHFSVDHIAGMLEMYEHEIAVEVRRTDTPPEMPDQGSVFGSDSMHALSLLALMTAADQRMVTVGQTLIQLGMDCRLPTPGASQGGALALQPNAQYDAVATFPKRNSTVRPKVIPGVHFSTSRYLDVPDLLRALGFESTGAPAGRVAGDVLLNSGMIVMDSADGDRAVEVALERIGLQDWPPTQLARSSALWQARENDWGLVGVLLEAPEPIERFDPSARRWRLRVESLRCGGQTFEIVRRNASGSMLLFLAQTPFVPTGPLELKVSEISPSAPVGAATNILTALSAVSTSPAFVEFFA